MRTKTISVQTAAVLLALFSSLLPAMTEANEKTAFDRGVRLFAAGDYAGAAALFEQVLASEQDNAIVHFNLGSSYYKLGRYDQAREHFSKIGASHNLAPVAYYNLGLVAFRTKRRDLAIRWFQRCLESSDDRALKQLAAKQIARLKKREKRSSSIPNNFTGYYSIGIGRDDNVARVPDEILQVSNQRSGFLDLFLSSSYWINGSYRHGNAVKFGAALTHYDQVSRYSSNLLNVGLYHYRPLFGWHSRYGIHYYRSGLGGEGFQQRIRLQVRAGKRYKPKQRLRVQYEYSQINELSSLYSYLAGTQQRFKMENRTYLARGRLRIGYQLELNDKQDYRQADRFSSYSPVRHTVSVWYRSLLGRKWRGRIGLDYRFSDYQKENIVGGISKGVRKDRRLRGTFGVIYELTHHLDLEVSLRRTENDSNFAEREYVSNQVMFSVGGYF